MLNILKEVNILLGPYLITFLLGFSTIVLLWWNSARKHKYWKKVGFPYVKPTPFLGSIRENIKKPIHDTELERYQKYGRIYGLYEGTKPVLSIGDPEILKQILVKDFHAFTGRRTLPVTDKVAGKMIQFLQGEDWKRVRTIVTPTFTTGKIKRMMGIFKECSETLVQNFREAAKKRELINAKSLYSAFTMDVIASSAFSTKIDSHNDPNNEFLQYARTVFGSGLNWKFIIFIIFPGLIKFFGVNVFPKAGVDFFSRVTLQIIEERRRTGKTRNDFLQLLLDTAKESSEDNKEDTDIRDDIAENYGKDENAQIFKQTTYKKKTLSYDELLAQCIIFFLAGFETAASTLSFASYCLAINPDVQEKLIEEIDNALDENNGELTYEAVQSMKYLNNVISETLRVFPPAIRLERTADEDYKLPDGGFTIPKGMLITIPVYAIHRDPTIYPNPEKFDPDRFTPEEREKRSQYAYLPFGAGPRNCIAMRFALMEVKVCLAHVLSNFRIKRCSQTKVPLEFHIGQGLLQPKEIILEFEERKDRVEIK